jgi:DNA mismatch repair protein MutL
LRYLFVMPEIRVLPERVANQIAAGEVVERPAAVVKELLENSLDAGATRVSVEFRHGGKSLMAVEDNGCGMTPDQALMSLEMHATSKIRSSDDLNEIHTFGFRGEAVPSIASVSRFTLRTRPADALSGTEVFVNAGKLLYQKETGMAPGTRIEVANLFHPVPARLKFLKSENTEAAHITRLVRLYAVAQPQAGFTLSEDGEEIFRSPAAASLLERVAAIWGNAFARDLAVLEPAESNEMRLWGLLGKPGVGRSTRQEMVTIVNGRPVDSRALAYALVESFHTLLPKGRYPLAFLFLEIAPHLVDVNVHPAKREIRFRDEVRVRHFVITTVMKHLQASTGREEQSGEQGGEPSGSEARAVGGEGEGGSGGTEAAGATETFAPTCATAPQPLTPSTPSTPSTSSTPSTLSTPVPAAYASPAPRSYAAYASPAAPPVAASPFRLDWRLAGRLTDELFLFEAGVSLVVLNLRAARARIWYERILQRFADNTPVSQQLLLPIPLELDPLAATVYREGAAVLAAAGFDIEEFGRNFFRILATPDWLGDADAARIVRDIIAGLGRGGTADNHHARFAHEFLAKLAADRAAASTRETLSDDLAKATVRELFLCRQPTVSPVGKPVFFEVSRAEIARRLGS